MEYPGVVIWLTGLSGSGKTTISRAVKEKLKFKGYRVEILDGDIIRQNLTKDLGFSREDRVENIRRIHFVSRLLARNGVIVIVASISPYRNIREEIKKEGNIIEIYVNAPLEVCESRDVKGLYKKARAGEIKNFTGIDDPYEPPLHPDVECYTHIESLEKCVGKIVEKLGELKYITN